MTFKFICLEARIRTFTLDLCCVVIRQLLLAMEASVESHLECETRANKAKSQVVDALAPYVQSEDLFLEMFEDEYHSFEVI